MTQERGVGGTTGTARATGPLRGSWEPSGGPMPMRAFAIPQTASCGATRPRGVLQQMVWPMISSLELAARGCAVEAVPADSLHLWCRTRFD